MAFYIQTNNPKWCVRIPRGPNPIKVVANPFNSPSHFNLSTPITRKNLDIARKVARDQQLTLFDYKRVGYVEDGK